jgi:ATP phosphoribosyltransferase
MDRQQRLRIAVQKSGRLTDESLDLLHRCGLKFSRGKDQLMCYGENMPLDVLFVRDDDIPDLVQEDVCDLGLVGLNVLEEKRLAMAARGTPPHRVAAETRLRALPAVARRTRRASLHGSRSIAGKRIATTYPHVLARFLAKTRSRRRSSRCPGRRDCAPARSRRPHLRSRRTGRR